MINNFAAGGNGIFNNDQFNVRIDDQTTSKLHSFGRYSFANYTLTGAAAFGDLGGNGFGTGGFAGASKSRDQSVRQDLTTLSGPAFSLTSASATCVITWAWNQTASGPPRLRM